MTFKATVLETISNGVIINKS